jgi:hypothetical protein
MEEQKSMIMSFTFDANSVFCDTAKTALEKVCEEGKIAGSLAARFSGLKLYVVGNVDKVISIKIAWDSGNPNEVGAAAFEALGGLVGASAGSAGGSWLGATAFAESGGWIWTPVVGGYLGDKAGGWAGEKAWEYLNENNKQAILNFAGIGNIGVHVSMEDVIPYYSVNPKLSAGIWQSILIGSSSNAKDFPRQEGNDPSNNVSSGVVTTPILEPTRYFLEFEIKAGDGWDTLEAMYGPKIRDLPEYGTIQSPGNKRFQIEVTGGELAELYYSGKLRPGDKGFAIIGDGGVLSHLSAYFGEDITPDSLAKVNGIEKDSVNPGQNITVFSVLSNTINSTSITSISDTVSNEIGALSSAVAFEQIWQDNFQTILGPTNPAFVHAEPIDGYTLEYNPNGVLWNVNAAGIPTIEDFSKYVEQQRVIESTNNQTIIEIQDSSSLPMV